VSHEPSVLDLRAIIVSNNTVKGNGVSCNGLNTHSIVTSRTVCTVSTVNENGVSVFILNVHITVGGVLDLLNDTTYVVFVSCSGIVLLRVTNGNCLFNCDSGIGGGLCGFGFAANGANVGYIVVTARFNDIVLIAISTACNLTDVKGVALFGAGSRDNSTCAKVVVVTLIAGFTGRSGHIGGNLLAKENESQFGIVNEYVTCARDRFNRVVTAKLPSVNRVCFHPFKQNVNAFHYAGSAPSIRGVAPTNVNVQEDTGYVTAKVVLAAGFLVGIVIAATFTVGGIAARGIFAGRSGADHHNIIFVTTAKSLTVGPCVFFVPAAFSPIRADCISGIERGNFPTAILTVGVLQQIVVRFIRVDITVVAYHQLFQLTIKLALGSIGLAGAAGKGREFVIGCIVILVEILCIG